MRSRLLSKFKGEEDLSKMMILMLQNTPSCTCNWICDTCKNSYHVNLQFLQVGNNNDLSKLNDDIDKHLKCLNSCENVCSTCTTVMVVSELIIGDHLFVTIKKDEISLAEIPEIIKISKDTCILFGAILYMDPLLEGDKGHYVASIKINATWSIFDDRKSKSYFFSSKKKVSVHTLLYIKNSENLSKEAKTTTEFRSGVTASETNSLKRKAEYCKENDAPVEKHRAIRPNENKNQQEIAARPLSSLPKSKETTIEQIGLLRNGCSYKVNNARVYLRNTCAFDSIAHVS